MGFDPFANEGLIDFSQTRYDGAEIKVRLDIPLGKLQEYDAQELHRDEVVWFLKNAVVSWNLEKDGKPLPLDTPLEEMPFRMLSYATVAWVRALNNVTEVAAPLENDSPSGGTSAGQ